MTRNCAELPFWRSLIRRPVWSRWFATAWIPPPTRISRWINLKLGADFFFDSPPFWQWHGGMMPLLKKFGFPLLLATLICSTSFAADKDTRCFEMRTYYAAPGKLDELHARFRDHTMKLFEKHGMSNIGYWTPVENSSHKLIYVL